MGAERREMTTGIIVLQPDREVPAGILGARLAERGAAVAVHELWHGTALPDATSTCAGLVVLGGSASALGGEDGFDRVAIVAALRSRLATGRPTLGLSLGAQLLTLALGGAIRPAAAPEFGYVDLVPTALAAGDPVLRGIGAGLPLMEWHEDGLELPATAQPLAHCHRGRVLAFRSGPWAYGLQFHPGADAAMVRRWARLRGEQRNNPAVPVRIGAEIVRHQERAERFGRSVADGWLGLVASAA